MEICAKNSMLVGNNASLLERMQVAVADFIGAPMSDISEDAQKKVFSIPIEELKDIKLSLDGNSDAYKRIIEKHQKHISKIMWRFSRDARTHEDLVQDVFVEAYLGLKTYKAKAPLENWLARIATRVGYNYWKQQDKLKKIETFALEDWDRLEQESEEYQDPETAAELLYKLLEKLGARDRLVITLRFVEQCSIEETAKRIGWSESMVKVQTFRAKKKLQQLFDKVGKELEI